MVDMTAVRRRARRSTDRHGVQAPQWISTLLGVVLIAAVTRVAAAYPPLCVAGVAVLVAATLVLGARSVHVHRSPSWRWGWLLLAVALVLAATASVLRVVGAERPVDLSTSQMLSNVGNVLGLAGLAM